MEVFVTAAHVQDAEAVQQVLTASYCKLMRGTYSDELLAQALPRMVSPNPRLLGSGTYLLAEVDGQPVGCGGWSLAAPGSARTEAGTAHIRHFATHPDWTGQGIGRLIYERCEIQARAAAVRIFECYSSLNGEAFYSALGFERIGPIEVQMGPDVSFPSVHMRHLI